MPRNVQKYARLTLAGLAATSMVITPLNAQFGGLLPSIPRDAVNDAQSTESGCAEGESKSTAGKVLGGLLGRVTQRAASRAGISSWVPIGEVADQLTNSIACRLDPEEQKQAAEATLAATRSTAADAEGETAAVVEVGSTATWTSATREDVSGSSTVVAREGGGDLDCILVTDVVIVKGEETTANKRMCRPPGSRRYSIIA